MSTSSAKWERFCSVIHYPEFPLPTFMPRPQIPVSRCLCYASWISDCFSRWHLPTRHAEVRWGFLMENVCGGMRFAGLWEALHVSSACESCPLQCIPIANALFCVTLSKWHCLSFTACILTPTVTPSMWVLFGNCWNMVQGAEKNAFCCKKNWP